MKQLLLIFSLMAFYSCDNPKTYVKSIDITTSTHMNWYYTSFIGNETRAFVEIDNNDERKIVFESEKLTDIKYKHDTITFQVDGSFAMKKANNYVYIDTTFIKSLGYKFFIDTTGNFENNQDYRTSRLRKNDLSKPHYVNSDKD